jgi:nitroreductase
VIAAESEGLGICYIGGIRNDPQRITELLDLPLGVYPVFGLCLGYPDQNPDIKPRLPLSVIVKDETYNERGNEEEVREYDKQIERYYKQRMGGSHGISWSKQVSKLLGEKSRPHMRDYLRNQGFKFE